MRRADHPRLRPAHLRGAARARSLDDHCVTTPLEEPPAAEPRLGARRRALLGNGGAHAKLVSVTRIAKSATRKRRISGKRPKRAGGGTWIFQDAKARLSEVVRRARSEGPQHVTVHGRPGVVVLAEEEFRRLRGNITGAALVDAMQASPFREMDIEPPRARLPVRDVGFP